MRNRKAQGFTLIELLIVIAIIGILAAVLIPNLMNARRVAVDRAAQGFAQNIYTAGNAYLAENVDEDVADALALDADCVDGVTYGAYRVAAPSFSVDAGDCDVEETTTGDFMITLTYGGGTDTNIVFPAGSVAAP